MLRTQIYLPEDLRRKIDKARSADESLSEYIRKSLEEKVKKEEKQKVDLKKLAKDVTSGVKISGWEGIDVVSWQREIRQDRKII